MQKAICKLIRRKIFCAAVLLWLAIRFMGAQNNAEMLMKAIAMKKKGEKIARRESENI
jgi:hypothetical protein